METTYSSKSVARRAAHRQKLNPADYSVEQAGDRWVIVQTPVEPTPPSEPNPQPEPVPQRTVKVTKRSVSTASSPVAMIWHWLAQADRASMKRADAIAALVALGIHPGTASTQRQKFLNASTAERTARVSRYADSL